MEIRMVSYGYEIKDGKLEIIEEEAKIVREIFQKYARGESLKTIADDLTEKKIIYFKNSYQWNKNLIKRILENQKYIGENDYPPILTLKEYEKTQLIKKDKEFKKKELSEEIQFLKKIVKCQDCGNLCYRNVNKKWLCKNKCNDKNSITDSVLITSILKGSKQIIENSKNLNSRQLQKHFYEGIETLQYLKEIYRRIDEQEMNNRLIKKLIVQYASSRFDKCVENLDIYSNFVLENSKQLISNQQQLVQYLKNNIINIEISKKNIEIHYINGVSLLIKEDENE